MFIKVKGGRLCAAARGDTTTHWDDMPGFPALASFKAKQWHDKLKAAAGSLFTYTLSLQQAQALDPTFSGPANSFDIKVNVAADGVTSCDDPSCPTQAWGPKPTTRAEFSAAKHALVHWKRQLAKQAKPRTQSQTKSAPAPMKAPSKPKGQRPMLSLRRGWQRGLHIRRQRRCRDGWRGRQRRCR